MTSIRERLLLSVQRALWGRVPSHLRAVSCGWRDTEIMLQFIFDGVISQTDLDDAQCASSEVIADFSATWTIREEAIRLDFPADLKGASLELLAFLRRE